MGLRHPVVTTLDWLNRKGKSASVRLVQLTGKSPHRIHPKHLVEQPWHFWYAHALRPGDCVLDIGCGNGVHTLRAAADAAWVRGMDHDPRNLRVAEALAAAGRRHNVRFQYGDAERPLPFADGEFDTVLCLDLLEHVRNRQGLLREIHRVLTPEGYLYVTAPNSQTRWRTRLRAAGLFAYSDPDHKIEYSRREFLDELDRAGFDAGIGSVVSDTPWAGLIDVVGGVSLPLYARLSRWKRRRALEHPEESTGFTAVAWKRI